MYIYRKLVGCHGSHGSPRRSAPEYGVVNPPLVELGLLDII